MSHEVTELHCIMPIANIPSVLEHGLLSSEQAARLPHADVSMAAIQERRDHIHVPGGLRLHQYANLYFDARNPMMFKRKNEAEALCVMCVSKAVLEIDGVVITDQNASSDYARFFPPTALNCLDFEMIYADDWRHPGDPIAYWRHKSMKCAEVLVPHALPCDYLVGAYVVNEMVKVLLVNAGFDNSIEISPRLFFR